MRVCVCVCVEVTGHGGRYIDYHDEEEDDNFDTAQTLQAGVATDVSKGYTEADRVTPLWDAGLDGTGQVVAFCDSGMDYKSCFFRDPNVPVTFSGKEFKSTTHRKLASYYAHGDNL